MSQPKGGTTSVRLGDHREAQIMAYARRRQLSRHAAILELIDRGLKRREVTT